MSQGINTKICETLSAMSNKNLQTPNYVQLHLEIPQTPMEFHSIDLFGPFETTTRGNQYTLTVICMLTNYTIYIPLQDKSTDTMVNAYLKEVYCRFRGNQKNLSDNEK